MEGHFYVVPKEKAKKYSDKGLNWFTALELARLIGSEVTDEKSLLAVIRTKRIFNGYIPKVEVPNVAAEPSPVTKSVTQDIGPKTPIHQILSTTGSRVTDVTALGGVDR